MRKAIIAGNWKMNKGIEEAKSAFASLAAQTWPSHVEVIIAAPFIQLSSVNSYTSLSEKFYLAAQNCHPEPKGAYTGEISIPMLKEVGVSHIIIGHSERREHFKEDNKFIASKVNAILENDCTPIFCCGEPLNIRKANEQEAYVQQQIQESLFQLSESDIKKVVIAYEPIWAIGTGETASPEQAQEMHASIRSFIAERFSPETADGISILYGGSVKPANAADLFSNQDVDGGLVGGASLKPEVFEEVINAFPA
ncbi:MAG: triose-phosphate isomerase [Bacteroidota bacterium]